MSKEIAYQMYLSDCKLSLVGTPGSSVRPRTWDELDHDEEQLCYLGYANVLKENLEQVKTDLLAWAGLHRGYDISEEVMPRFHEIIDRLDALIK